MAGVKMVPIRDGDGNVVAHRFEPSKEFTDSLARNYVELKDESGRSIRANKKLAANGHYGNKGFESVPVKQKAKE
jgi:hypothetical protein